ncbi:hypothetical protein QR98_0105590 [Sarcoptes scabiei]|uniref:Uncharacterized protein n=1 Tax=Sarcoptes scabiei TaxID=52283 RepID=A0A132AM97_SARSC|nr:hypothetical protein QR98_0105590 [Sarcoptes scabiei]
MTNRILPSLLILSIIWEKIHNKLIDFAQELFPQPTDDGGECIPFKLLLVAAADIGDSGVLLLAMAGERQGPSEFGAAPPTESLVPDDGVDDMLDCPMFADEAFMHEVPKDIEPPCELA